MKKIFITLFILINSFGAQAAPAIYAEELLCQAFNEDGTSTTNLTEIVLFTRLSELSQSTLLSSKGNQFYYRELMGFNLNPGEYDNHGGYNAVMMSEESSIYQYRQTSCDSNDDYFLFKLSDLTLQTLQSNKMLVGGFLYHQNRNQIQIFKLMCTAK